MKTAMISSCHTTSTATAYDYDCDYGHHGMDRGGQPSPMREWILEDLRLGIDPGDLFRRCIERQVQRDAPAMLDESDRIEMVALLCGDQVVSAMFEKVYQAALAA